MQDKVDLLKAKNCVNEAKIKEQEEEIIKLKTKLDSKFESDHFLTSLVNDERVLRHSTDNKINRIHENRIASDHSSPRAYIPSSCRELGIAGHSLNGLYLIQNVDTNQIQTVFCDFGTSGKLIKQKI